MSYTKEQVLEALKGVMYFPKTNNIVALNMVQDIKIEEKQISFTLVFPDSKDKSSAIVVPAARKAIKNSLGEHLEVGIKTTSADLIGGKAPMSGVKNIIGVASGKGGVGKSTVAANTAIALAKTGAKVGILDADIYGPSVPLMFGLVDGHPDVKKINGKDVIIPLEKYGIKILSVGFFVDPKQALIWRGAMVTNALKQLVNDTDWGDIDFLVVDLPPGTGDVQLTLVQEVSVTGVVIVTTPQEMALSDARKAFGMFETKQINVPILGLVENMSYFTPAELPDNKYYIFGKDGGKKIAEQYNVPLLGQIPIVESICDAGDKGTPIALDEESIIGKSFKNLANTIIEKTEKRNSEQSATKRVKINH
ncbi:MAG: Mrp/NBP35 family ATP-binding protein [Bacteroidota bacterium]|nr:Mrp/NBP35 family ATP-binding protein [Bacteroidota bacterium]